MVVVICELGNINESVIEFRIALLLIVDFNLEDYVSREVLSSLAVFACGKKT